jgi:acetylornithine/N-succinyldiaminopimelate aminotransferase
MEKAFHGRTMATLSATGNRKAQAGFEPLVHPASCACLQRSRGDQRSPSTIKNVVAVMLEIVQGEGGINVADEEYQRGLRALCDEKGWLLICDEVQCGMGRTGKWFGYQHAGIQPDVATLAKGLGVGRADRRLHDRRQGGRAVRAGQPRLDLSAATRWPALRR